MNTIEFSKRKGETLDVGALLSWVERHINWLGNGLYELKIAKKVKRRSLPQNRLMWMWFACISKDCGQSVDDIHDYYCYKYLPRYITDIETGSQVRVAGHLDPHHRGFHRLPQPSAGRRGHGTWNNIARPRRFGLGRVRTTI